jgi:hypothetical protein
MVINKSPAFSTPLPYDVRKSLVLRFPQGQDIGTFEVRWRD